MTDEDKKALTYIDELKAWVYWVKKNPISDDQLSFAQSVGELIDDFSQAKDDLVRLRVKLQKIADFETLDDGEKYVSYEQGWYGVAEFARVALSLIGSR